MPDLSIDPPQRSALLRAPAEPGLAITAQYTSQVWLSGGLPCAELFATVEAKRVYDVTNAALGLARLVRRDLAPLRESLLHRHAMIDHLMRESGARTILELAAGLSRRGATVSADPAIAYRELDLPPMVAAKRRLLARTPAGRAVLARENFVLAEGDALTAALPASELVIAEGLMMYLSGDARRALFARVIASTFVFDLVPASEEPVPGRVGRALETAMKRFTGGRGFTRDALTRAQILAELRAAGFRTAEAIAARDIAAAWQLPSPAAKTLTVVFRATRS